LAGSFVFTVAAPTVISTPSLHDALPISAGLNDRVRDGNGWFPRAMAAGHSVFWVFGGCVGSSCALASWRWTHPLGRPFARASATHLFGPFCCRREIVGLAKPHGRLVRLG